MEAKLTKEEIDFMGCMYDPIVFTENIIPLDKHTIKLSNNPSDWDENTECIKIRPYQYLFVSYEYLYANDNKLTPKENFKRRIGAGTSYLFCGRKIGKSVIGLDCDNLCDIALNDGFETCVSSFDGLHLRKRMSWVCEYVDSHPFFQIFHLRSRKKTVNRGNYWIATENGHQTYSINENIKGQNVGSGYHQVHYNRFLYEENSYETEKGHSKRIDSGAEIGFIERLSGIPAFHKASPAAKIFNDTNKLKYLVRLPAYISPLWDEEENEKRKKEYGGEGSAGYKINILAQIMQDVQSGFDMDRVRKNYNHDKFIKAFEITKDNYKNFKNEIIVDKLKNAEKVYITADIGDGAAPSEIIIIFKVKNKYLYRYNITLFGLIDEEQYQVILWLYNKIDADYIGLDTTDGTGRAVYRRLAKVIKKKYLIWVHLSEKIVIGFEKDDDGKIKHNSKGQVIEKHEYVQEWSFQILKELMYDQSFDIALDDKVDLQFDGMIQTTSGNRTLYDNMTDNHLLQAFQVFAIAQWQTESQPRAEKKKGILSLGISSTEESK